MTKLSALIPNRNSPYLTATIRDLLTKAAGDIEVVVNVDGDRPAELVADKRVTYLFNDHTIGMRAGINRALAAASGEFVMKCDDHCMFAPGFDTALIGAHQADNWVQIPRRYSLDAEHWAINRGRPHRDYLYLCYPAKGKHHDDGMHGVEWWERQNERAHRHEYDIDDTPSLQGSCYFMTRHHFAETLGGMQPLGYGQFAQEAQEIGNKTWLGGGRVVVNKLTWYAHWHKGHAGRGYRFNDRENVKGINWSAWYWMTNQWATRCHDIAWLVDEKFPAMPTWPVDWKSKWYENAAVPVS